MRLSGTSKYLSRLVEPRAESEDPRRQEYILNVLVLGAIVLSAAATLSSFITSLAGGQQGIPLIFMVMLLGIFVGLYIMSRKGLHRAASYLLILFYFVPTTFAIVTWGVELPQGLLTYALIIILSGVLIGTRFAWTITSVIAVVLVSAWSFDSIGYLIFDRAWQGDSLNLGDVIVFLFTFFNILVVSWLSNRETEKFLLRARTSEKALERERDLLEEKVEKRTRELERAHEERIVRLSRFAEFGRKTGAVIHDLVNPIAAITLNLKRIEDLDEGKVELSRDHLKLAIRATEGMQDYVDVIKDELHQVDVKVAFDIDREIERSIEMVSVKAEAKNIRITYDGPKSVWCIGGPVKFRNAIANLISNAIDAYDKSVKDASREVLISLRKTENEVYLSVKDWGEGIEKKDLDNIRKPFYTTKVSKQNLGIGLSIVTDVIEKEFFGVLEIDSEEGHGTTFAIRLPINEPDKKQPKVNA